MTAPVVDDGGLVGEVAGWGARAVPRASIVAGTKGATPSRALRTVILSELGQRGARERLFVLGRRRGRRRHRRRARRTAAAESPPRSGWASAGAPTSAASAGGRASDTSSSRARVMPTYMSRRSSPRSTVGVEHVGPVGIERALVRQQLLFHADEKHDRELEPLGAVQRDQRDLVGGVVAVVVVLGVERDAVQEAAEVARLRAARSARATSRKPSRFSSFFCAASGVGAAACEIVLQPRRCQIGARRLFEPAGMQAALRRGEERAAVLDEIAERGSAALRVAIGDVASAAISCAFWQASNSGMALLASPPARCARASSGRCRAPDS